MSASIKSTLQNIYMWGAVAEKLHYPTWLIRLGLCNYHFCYDYYFNYKLSLFFNQWPEFVQGIANRSLGPCDWCPTQENQDKIITVPHPFLLSLLQSENPYSHWHPFVAVQFTKLFIYSFRFFSWTALHTVESSLTEKITCLCIINTVCKSKIVV